MDPILDTTHSYGTLGPGQLLGLPRPCKRTRMDPAAVQHSDTCCGRRGGVSNSTLELGSPDSTPDVGYTIEHPLECTCCLAALPPLPPTHDTSPPQSQQTQQRSFIAQWTATRPQPQSQPQPQPQPQPQQQLQLVPPVAGTQGSPAYNHSGGGSNRCVPAGEGPQATALSMPHPPARAGPTPPMCPILTSQDAHRSFAGGDPMPCPLHSGILQSEQHTAVLNLPFVGAPNTAPTSPRPAASSSPPPASQGNLVAGAIATAQGHADSSAPSDSLVSASAAAAQGSTAIETQHVAPLQTSDGSPTSDQHAAALASDSPNLTASAGRGVEEGASPDPDCSAILEGVLRKAEAAKSGVRGSTGAKLVLCPTAEWRIPVLPPITTGQPTAVAPCSFGTGSCAVAVGSCAMGLMGGTGAMRPLRKALNVLVQNGCETSHCQPVIGFDYAKMWRVVGDTLEWPCQALATGTAAAATCGSALPVGAPCGPIESGTSLLAGPGSLPQSSLPSNVVTTGNIIERILAPLTPTGGGGGNGGGSTLPATGSGTSSVRQSPGGSMPYTMHPEQPQPHAASQEQLWSYSTGPGPGAVLMMGGGLDGATPMTRQVGPLAPRPGLAPNAVTTGAAPVSAAAEALAAGAGSRRRLGCSSGGPRDGSSRMYPAADGYAGHGQGGEESSNDDSSSSEGEEEEEEAGHGGARNGDTSSSASQGGLGGEGERAVDDVRTTLELQRQQQQQLQQEQPHPLACEPHQLESLRHQQALPCPPAPIPIHYAIQTAIPYPHTVPMVPYSGAPVRYGRYAPGMPGGYWGWRGGPSAGISVPSHPTALPGAVGSHCNPCNGSKGGSDSGGEGAGEDEGAHQAGPPGATQADCGGAAPDHGTPAAMGDPYMPYTCYGGASVTGDGSFVPSAAGVATTAPEKQHMLGPTYGTDGPQHMYECCICAKRHLPQPDAAMHAQQSSAKHCRRRLLFTAAEETVWAAEVPYMGGGDISTQHQGRPGAPGPIGPGAPAACTVTAAATTPQAAAAGAVRHEIETAADGHQRCVDGTAEAAAATVTCTPSSANAVQCGSSWLGPWSAVTPNRQHPSAAGAVTNEPTRVPTYYPHPGVHPHQETQSQSQPQPKEHAQPQQLPHSQPQPQPQPQQMLTWTYTDTCAMAKPGRDNDNSYRPARTVPSVSPQGEGNHETVEYEGEASGVGSRRSSYSSGDAAAVVGEGAVGLGAPEAFGPRQPQPYSADASIGSRRRRWTALPPDQCGNGTAGRQAYDGHATNSVDTAVAQSISGGAEGTSSIGPCGCTACMQARALARYRGVNSVEPDVAPTGYGLVMTAPPSPPPQPHAPGGPMSSSWSGPPVHYSLSVPQPPPYNGCNCELCRAALATGQYPPTRSRSSTSWQLPSGPPPPPSHRHYHHHRQHYPYQRQQQQQPHPQPWLPQYPPPPPPMQTQPHSTPPRSSHPSSCTQAPPYPPHYPLCVPTAPTNVHTRSRSLPNGPPPSPPPALPYSTAFEWSTAGPAGRPPPKVNAHAPDGTARREEPTPPPPLAFSAPPPPPCPCPACKAAVSPRHYSHQQRLTPPSSSMNPTTTAQQAQAQAAGPYESHLQDARGQLARDRGGGMLCGAGAPRTSHGSVLCADDASSAATGTHTHVPAPPPPPLSEPTPLASSQPLSGPVAGPSAALQSAQCLGPAVAHCTAVPPALPPPMHRPPYNHPSNSHGSYAVTPTDPLPMRSTHRHMESAAHAPRSSSYTFHVASHPASLTTPSSDQPSAMAATPAAAAAGAASPYPPCPSTQPSHPSSQNTCSGVSVPAVPHQPDNPAPSHHHVQPSPDHRLSGAPAWMSPQHRAAQQQHYLQQQLLHSQAASCPHQPPTPVRSEQPGNCHSHVASFSNPSAASLTGPLVTAAGPAAPAIQPGQAPPRYTATGHLPYGHMQAPPPLQHPVDQPALPQSPFLKASACQAHSSGSAAPICSTSFPQYNQQPHREWYQQTAPPPTWLPRPQLPTYPYQHHPPHNLTSNPPQHPPPPPSPSPSHPIPPPPPRQHSTPTQAKGPNTRSTGTSATTHPPAPPQGRPPAQPTPLAVVGTVTDGTADLTSGYSRPGFCDHCGSAMVELDQPPMTEGISCGVQAPVGVESPQQSQPHSGRPQHPYCHNHQDCHNHHHQQNPNRQNPDHHNYQSQSQHDVEVFGALSTVGMRMRRFEQPPQPQAPAAPVSSQHPHAVEPQQLVAREQEGERGAPLHPQQHQSQQLQSLHRHHHQQQQAGSHHYQQQQQQQQVVMPSWHQGIPLQQQRQAEMSAPEVGNGGAEHAEEDDAMWADNPLIAWPGRAKRTVLSGVADV